MQNTSSKKDGEERVLMDALSSCGPVAKGSLSQVRMKCAKSGCGACKSGRGHLAWIFAYRVDGRRKCLYVRKGDVPKVEVRNAREAPFGENTPSSKLNFKKDSDEAAGVFGAREAH